MAINRKTVAIICVIFAIGLLTGCRAQDKGAEKTPAAKKAEVKEKATDLEEKAGEVRPAQKKIGPVTEPIEKASEPKFEVSAQYVGAKKCKKCHIKHYKSWGKTKMAVSFENLRPGIMADAKKKAGLDPDKDYTADPGCLKCHTTGHGKPSGFISLEKTPYLINVQCESCHGPGSEYMKIMKKNRNFKLDEVSAVGFVVLTGTAAEKECLLCHGDENPFNEKVDLIYKFDLEDRVKNTHVHIPLKYKH